MSKKNTNSLTEVWEGHHRPRTVPSPRRHPRGAVSDEPLKLGPLQPPSVGPGTSRRTEETKKSLCPSGSPHRVNGSRCAPKVLSSVQGVVDPHGGRVDRGQDPESNWKVPRLPSNVDQPVSTRGSRMDRGPLSISDSVFPVCLGRKDTPPRWNPGTLIV